MKYIIIAVAIAIVAFMLYQRKNNTISAIGNDYFKNNDETWTSQSNKVALSSDTLMEILEEDYNRFIFAKHTSTDYLLRMIKEYGELSGNEDYEVHKFWLGSNGDWHVVKVGGSIDFYTYHNLVGWFTGYEENPDIPEKSIGYSKSKTNSNEDYIFYLDPKIYAGDTMIGTFKNGKSFSIYLPEAYEPLGNMTATNDPKVLYKETIDFLNTNGLDIAALKSIEFTEYQIRMSE